MRRATGRLPSPGQAGEDFYPRSPCGERRILPWRSWMNQRFLSTLSLRRATRVSMYSVSPPIFLSTLSLRRATSSTQCRLKLSKYFYPRSPCGERLGSLLQLLGGEEISIHALLAESDIKGLRHRCANFYFYPRSPCGERPYLHVTPSQIVEFLSTLSLRRATGPLRVHRAPI